VAVGIFVFVGNWAGPIWWASTGTMQLLDRRKGASNASFLHSRALGKWVSNGPTGFRPATTKSGPTGRDSNVEVASAKYTGHASFSNDAGFANAGSSYVDHIAVLTCFTACSVLAVMVSCTVLREHLFIWTVFSPKYLYEMAWAIGFHLFICIGGGGVLWWLGL
jgi:ethanolamine phosphate transferase 2 subunit G